jgi:hypothetical protein
LLHEGFTRQHLTNVRTSGCSSSLCGINGIWFKRRCADCSTASAGVLQSEFKRATENGKVRGSWKVITPDNLRSILKKIGVGRMLQLTNKVRKTGVGASLLSEYNKHKILPLILHAPPICFNPGGTHIHMLLHRRRFLDGLWSIYSLCFFSSEPVHFTIHNDGSLDSGCVDALRKIFPNVRVIQREEADLIVGRTLSRNNLAESIKLRERVVHARKLIDFYILSEGKSFVVLDSDVLTYADPVDLLSPASTTDGAIPHAFSPDNNDTATSLPIEIIQERLGWQVLRRLNAGLLHVQKDAVSLDLYEECLMKMLILSDARSKVYYAEQTVYAAALARSANCRLNDKLYTICGGPASSVTAHYCGGGYWATRLYREGLPHLSRQFGLLRQDGEKSEATVLGIEKEGACR